MPGQRAVLRAPTSTIAMALANENCGLHRARAPSHLMIRFDFYILWNILRPLAIALVMALVVFLIDRMLRLLDLVLGSNGPLNMVFEILAYLVPHYMGMALPISLFLGVLIAFSRLSQDGELDAMNAASAGLRRLARPAHGTACILMIITLVTVGYLQPYGRYAYQSLVFTISTASFHAFLRAGVFAQADGVSFLIEEIKPDGIGFGKVFIHEETEDGGSVAITARGGRLGYDESEAIPMLRLADGVRLEVKEPDASDASGASDAEPALPSINVLRFDELRTDLGRDAAELFRPRGKDEREFTLWELWQRRFDPPPDVRSSDMIAEFHGRIVHIFSVPLLPFLAIPLALGRRRSERSFGIAMGLVVLVVYNQVLDLGENITETGAISPWLGLWTPFFAFASGSLFLFHRATTQVPGTRIFAPLERFRRAVGSWMPGWARAREENP